MNLKTLPGGEGFCPPPGWEEFFAETIYDGKTGEYPSPAAQKLAEAVKDAYETEMVYPAPEALFAAFCHCPLSRVRVVLLGQDPYHEPGQAMGLSFSVPRGTKLPPSLRNIFKERENDLGIAPSENGDLTAWAKEGVLLLNTTLTVAAGEAGSHRRLGWKDFTDAVIRAVDAEPRPVAFILWGRDARAKKALLSAVPPAPRLVVESEHPSPLSAYRGFFGSKPFSRVNEWFSSLHLPPVDWNNDDTRSKPDN